MSKIKRVVLYKHGVGHFERQAKVTGDAGIKLAFRAEEMNDVLKSLIVFDHGGGVVSSISYDNKKPISKLLADISLDLPSDGGSVRLLSAVRGAEVAVTSGSRTIEGQIVGVDQKMISANGVSSQRDVLTVFDDKGRLQTFDLDEVSNVAFLDEEIQNDMRFLFKTVFSSKKQDAKTLKIFSSGQGIRHLDISYVVECPVWKTSYRIALASGDDAGSAYLQGWALVDNPQDEDWSDVELSLVSGLPISFRHDLYSPRYLERKEIEVQRESASGPVMAEGALFGGGGQVDPFAMADLAQSAPPVAPSASAMMRQSFAPPSPVATIGGSTKVETVTQTVGQLFEYKIDRPVTVLRNQSALVPIVSDHFDGGKKLLYNQAERPENPFSVVDFKNTTGLTLEGGPVTIYEGEIYAGEAMMDTVGPDEERMLPYAVALDVDVMVKTESETKSVSQSVSQGTWRHKRADYSTTEYCMVNKGASKKTIVVEHPLSDTELVNTQEPTSETRNYWRFTVDVDADSDHTLKVTEKRVTDQVVAFSNSTVHNIRTLIVGAVAEGEQQKLLSELQTLCERERDIQGQIRACDMGRNEIVSEQDRIRQNLNSLKGSVEEKDLRARYVAILTAGENDMEEKKKKISALKKELKSLQNKVLKLAQSVTLERIFE